MKAIGLLAPWVSYSSLRPRSCRSSARPSICVICSVSELMRVAWVLIARSSGTASSTSTAHLTIASPISFICGVKERILNSMTALAVFCIWSMVLSIDVIRSWMSPRSKGVMKVRLTAIRTSRVMKSASCSRSMMTRYCCGTPSPPSSIWRSASAPATTVCEWRANSSKKRSSLGIKARNQPNIALLQIPAPECAHKPKTPGFTRQKPGFRRPVDRIRPIGTRQKPHRRRVLRWSPVLEVKQRHSWPQGLAPAGPGRAAKTASRRQAGRAGTRCAESASPLGDFGDQLFQDRVREGIVARRRHHEGAGPADHEVPVISVQIGLDRQDREPVDADAGAGRIVAGRGDGPAGIIRAVARYVDDAPRRAEGILRQQQAGIIDRAADRGAAAEQLARRGFNRDREGFRRRFVPDQHPGDDLDLQPRAGPLEHRHRNRLGQAGADRLQHPRIAEGGDVALLLQLEAMLVDAARGIDREHQREIGLRLGPWRRPSRRRARAPPSPRGAGA